MYGLSIGIDYDLMLCRGGDTNITDKLKKKYFNNTFQLYLSNFQQSEMKLELCFTIIDKFYHRGLVSYTEIQSNSLSNPTFHKIFSR